MEHFLDTESTIVKGLGFDLFGGIHLIWLVIAVVSIVLAALQYRNLNEKGRMYWRRCVAVLLIADEIFKLAFLLVGGNFTKNYLPLHLCNINIGIIAYHAWNPRPVIGNYLYTICVPATIAALLFPSWEGLPVLNFMHLHSFTLHILLAMYPLVLTLNGDIKPRAKDIPCCLLVLLGLAAVVFGINLLLDTNYFYLMEAPKGNPLYWFQQNWGNHWLGFPFLVGGAVLLMYLPVELHNLLESKHLVTRLTKT